MRVYSLGALFKVLIGLLIMWVLYRYVNVYQDPVLGLSFGFFALFMVIWWASYFFFLIGYKFFSQKSDHLQSSLSYKLSLLVWLFAMTNLTLMVVDKWSLFLSLVLLIIFLLLQMVITYEKYPSRNLENSR